MVAVSHRTLASFLSLALTFAACSGGGVGGDGPPDLGPNATPVVPVPAGLSGSMPHLRWIVDRSASQPVQFAAADADGDALTWQISVSGAAATALGLRLPITPIGNTVRLELDPVLAPATGVVTLLVQDPRAAVFAFQVTVVRGGAPTLTSVTPTSAFGGRPLRVALTGSAFDLAGTAAPQVRFGGLLATSLQTNGDAKLSCLTSSLPQSGPIGVSIQTAFGSASLPSGTFRMLSFPPAFATADVRVDAGGPTDAVEAGLDAEIACVATAAGGVLSLARSTDGGRTFGAAQPLSGGELASEPQVLVEGSRVFVAWIGNGQQVRLRRSLDAGATFDSAVLVGSGTGPVSGLQLVTSGERVHVAFVRGDAALGQARAVSCSSGDGGLAFAGERAIAPASANQSAVGIGADGTSVYAAFLDDRLGAGARGVYVARSTDSGATWLAARRLSAPNRQAAQLRTAHEGASMQVVWTTSDGLFVNGTTDRGLSWRTPEVPVATTADGAPESPFVHLSGARVQVAYTTNGTEVRLARSTDAGASFPVRTRLDPGSELDSTPVLAGTGDYTTVAWLSGDAVADGVRVAWAASTDGGSTFTTPTGLGDGASNQTSARLCQSGGRLLLAFRERRGLAIGAFANANGD